MLEIDVGMIGMLWLAYSASLDRFTQSVCLLHCLCPYNTISTDFGCCFSGDPLVKTIFFGIQGGNTSYVPRMRSLSQI